MQGIEAKKEILKKNPQKKTDIEKISKRVLEGDIWAAAKLIRMAEEEDMRIYSALEYLHPHTANAYILGVTGLPGSGKSTIVNYLIKHYRSQGKSVGVIAVDPSSPITSGAILGDRVRMIEHSKDSKVFIKSLATRGYYGGLSRSTLQIVNIMDAMGKDIIIVETVGVGQTEASIMNSAHTTILVLVPEMGDYVQTIKAGVLEIGDIFVINKIDKKDPLELKLNLESLIRNNSEKNKSPFWEQKIIFASSYSGTGMDKLTQTIEEHCLFFNSNLKKQYLKKRMLQEIEDEVLNYFIGFCRQNLKDLISAEDLVKEKSMEGKNPYKISGRIIEKLLNLIRDKE
ncbi:MAG: methylmalonyl Co-A mutase-associated GTPase MeaB [Actinobacteria bacterium]|nr:methylmalonyl Co-A mutase-associated GTPase MeaB [Actinomycetota bacterium]